MKYGTIECKGMNHMSVQMYVHMHMHTHAHTYTHANIHIRVYHTKIKQDNWKKTKSKK